MTWWGTAVQAMLAMGFQPGNVSWMGLALMSWCTQVGLRATLFT